jgi:hypothetical protein
MSDILKPIRCENKISKTHPSHGVFGNLTVGKVYSALEQSTFGDFLTVTDDDGDVCSVPRDLFACVDDDVSLLEQISILQGAILFLNSTVLSMQREIADLKARD